MSDPSPTETFPGTRKTAKKPAGAAPANRLAGAMELVNQHLYSVEERIREQARGFDPAVEGYVTYVCGQGGKRLRPALALLAGGATGKIAGPHIDLAVVIELIHVATLVHDDIMDGAELRRESPTANAKWGNAISVLLGDCLFAHALKLSTGFSNSDVCRRIADAAAEVCSGEIIQTQRRFDLKLGVNDYYKIIEMKTAALFSAACELGAFLNDASPAVIGALRGFGGKLGTAYQIYDDLLDIAGTEETSGKTLGTDLLKGKFTLPVLLMLQGGGGETLHNLLLAGDRPDADALREVLEQSGAIRTAASAIERLLREAVEALGPVPASRYRDGLQSIAAHVSGLTSRIA